MVVLQFGIREVVPPVSCQSDFVYTNGPANHLRARVSIQKGRGLDELPAVPTALALERFVRLAESVLVEQKQFTKGVE